MAGEVEVMTAGKMKSVYVMVSDQLGITKIGIASDPEVRRRMLQDASGIKLRLVHASEQRVDARAVEAAAHKLLHEKRKTGEWFDVTLEDAVAAIQEAADAVDDKISAGLNEALDIARKRGRPVIPDDQRRNIVAIRFEPELMAKIDAAAAELGMNRSQFVRESVAARVKRMERRK